jgi:hypothetical protein
MANENGKAMANCHAMLLAGCPVVVHLVFT